MEVVSRTKVKGGRGMGSGMGVVVSQTKATSRKSGGGVMDESEDWGGCCVADES